MRRFCSVLVAVCLLLAGCAAPAVSVTPAPAPTATPRPTPTPAPSAGRVGITLPPELRDPETPAPTPTPYLSQEEKLLHLELDPETMKLSVLQEGALTPMEGTRPIMPAFVGWEVPPSLVKLGDRWKVILATQQSGMVGLLEGNDFTDWANYDTEDTTMLCGENVRLDTYARYPESHYWSRNYYGVFDVRQDGKHIFFLNHCENKNDWGYGKVWYNSVMPQGTEFGPQDYSGDFGGGWRDYWPAYFGFVSLSAVPDVGEDSLYKDVVREYDLGPVVWPSQPYLDSSHVKVSDGIRHPSMLIHDGYMYLYYLEGSAIYMARAELDGEGMPGPFYKYYDGGFTEPALPEGFSTDDPEERSHFYKAGGRSTPLFDYNTPCRFSAAALGDTGYFVGVLELMSPQAATYITVSEDLIHWGAPRKIPGSQGTTWSDLPLAYPKLYSDDLTSCDTVDPAAFRVVGTGMGDRYKGYWYSRVRIDIAE